MKVPTRSPEPHPRAETCSNSTTTKVGHIVLQQDVGISARTFICQDLVRVHKIVPRNSGRSQPLADVPSASCNQGSRSLPTIWTKCRQISGQKCPILFWRGTTRKYGYCWSFCITSWGIPGTSSNNTSGPASMTTHIPESALRNTTVAPSTS